jgi:hypothetical protein
MSVSPVLTATNETTVAADVLVAIVSTRSEGMTVEERRCTNPRCGRRV